MASPRSIFCVVASLVALLVVAGPAAAQSLSLRSGDGVVHTVEAATLAALPRAEVSLDVHGQSHIFEGPLLMDVLKQGGVESGADLRGPALAQAVVVRASDGYAVVFGLAELDSGTRANRIILADTVDGAPLAADDGPYRVVAEGDLRPARSARQVTTLEVVRLPAGPSASTHHHAQP